MCVCTYPAAPTPAPADEAIADVAATETTTPAATPTPIATFALVPNVDGSDDGGILIVIDGDAGGSVEFTVVFTVVVAGPTRYGMLNEATKNA